MGKPLEGIRVLDLSTFVAAPVTGRLLADLGAEVIKIEPPQGDQWRLTGISYVPARFSPEENPVFDIYNAGKKMISVNLKTEDGLKVFHRLVARSDVFVTNNREAALKRLHVSYDDLKDLYPRLIFAQVTGFGAKGPDASIPAFDTTAFWSRTGFMRDMAVIQDDGSYMPTYPPSGVGDTVTAYLLLSQILAALLTREKTGKGQRVEACLYHTGIFTMGTMQIQTQRPWGRQYPFKRMYHSLPGGYYKCKDGEYIFIATGMVQKLMDQMSRAIGRPELATDPRFATSKDRYAHREELYHIFCEAFLTKTSDEWLDIAKELDFAAVKYKSFADISEDEQALANGFLEDVTFANGRTEKMPRAPFHMESLPELHTVPAPLCGADTSRVLAEAGFTAEEIEAMKENGSVMQSEPKQ
ncbi:MAG: CoA transferase [Lachnospiraceae bacterium]|nr:CoA transferase [Lachnospiraceae bacterium]